MTRLLIDSSELSDSDYIIVIRDQLLYTAGSLRWTPTRLRELDPRLVIAETVILVGEYQQQRCFACPVKLTPEALIDDEQTFVSLRACLPLLSDDSYQLASRAVQLITWCRQHRYCGQCGQATTISVDDTTENDSVLYCEHCDITYYPRISPCIMCLVVRGNECLLAHHQRHPDSMFSTLAGFVEAGETLEQTLHREVFEEVGIKVKNLRYFSSQPWPFPHQLMVGFFADYASGDIQPDGKEIIDAQWFRAHNLPMIPPPETLSGRLITQFIQECRD